MVRMPFPQNWMIENVQENPTLDEKQRVPLDVHTNQSIDNNFPTDKSQNHPNIFFIITPISSQYHPNMITFFVPSHMSFLLGLPWWIPNHNKAVVIAVVAIVRLRGSKRLPADPRMRRSRRRSWRRSKATPWPSQAPKWVWIKMEDRCGTTDRNV